MKKWIVCSLILLIATLYFFPKQTVTLFPYSIPSSLPFRPEWELSVLSPEEAKQIFSQPYTYLGKGHQSIAFESQDHQYVIKIPYHSHRLPPSWIRSLPIVGRKYQDKLTRSIQKHLAQEARSLTVAFNQWKEEAGLVAMHWNRSCTLQCSLTVRDDAHKIHTIDLDTVAFTVQRKAQLLFPALQEWMEAGRSDLAKEGLSQLVHFLYQRYEKGIDDKEQYLKGNVGFLGTRPMHIDVGHFSKIYRPRDPDREKEEVWRLLQPLKEQLDLTYPELSAHLILMLYFKNP